MPILGIHNRTENWKTAALFAPLLGERRVRLAHLLGEDWQTEPHEVSIELFWKGMRDYVDKMKDDYPDAIDAHKCRDSYLKLFPDLRGEITRFNDRVPLNRLQLPNEWNYDLSPDKQKEAGLFDNLLNTEIDIVLESPSLLFIGEAKQESRLGAAGGHVLVHQLIRQYVTASILIHIMGIEKKIIPFLVVDRGNHASVLNTGQVNFMLSQKWLKEENVLTWDDVRSLHP